MDVEKYYNLGGQEFYISSFLPELLPYKSVKEAVLMSDVPLSFEGSFSHSTLGWVGNAQHQVAIWNTPSGTLLKVSGESDIYISSDGQTLIPVKAGESKRVLTEFDRAVLLGTALVFALALQDRWSLHASAAMFRNQTIAFLGESGQGKSTFAAYLESDANWRRIADDILPTSCEVSNVEIFPRFPQLKLPPNKQPSFNFPERIPLNKICVLASVNKKAEPKLGLLLPSQALQVLLKHTAGTRLFTPELLKKHLDFCARAAETLPVYRLDYPHREDALPKVKELLEKIC